MMQFIYDIWYAHITPDRDFPREIRHILNWGFGELAARARRLDVADLRKMLLRSVLSFPSFTSRPLLIYSRGQHKTWMQGC